MFTSFPNHSILLIYQLLIAFVNCAIVGKNNNKIDHFVMKLTQNLIYQNRCFERSNEAHSINCKKFHHNLSEIKIDKSGLYDPRYSGSNDIKNKTLPKGFLSEYQHSYLNNPKHKVDSARVKDSLSFGNKRFIQDPFLSQNSSDVGSFNESSQNPLRR